MIYRIVSILVTAVFLASTLLSQAAYHNAIPQESYSSLILFFRQLNTTYNKLVESSIQTAEQPIINQISQNDIKTTLPTPSPISDSDLIPQTSFMIDFIPLIDFSKAKPWNSMSEEYKKYMDMKKMEKSFQFNHLFMGIRYNWNYAEDFKYSQNAITFIRNDSHFDTTKSFKKYNSQISIVHSIDTLPNSTSLYSKDPNPKQPVWYDQFAIFVTRGYANIYHNAEWIMNFIHIVNNIADFPLIDAFTVVNPSFENSQLGTSHWNKAFLQSVLSVFPKENRPIYISSSKVKQLKSVFIKRSLFISITTFIDDLYRSSYESLILRKTVYKHCKINILIPVPNKLKILYIAREGKTRQIVNEKELLEEVMKISDRIEMTKMFFSGLTFNQQVEIMTEVDIVFGVHGAAFINTLFMRPKSGLIEFFAQHFSRLYYKTIAMKSQHFYKAIHNNMIVNATIGSLPKNANILVTVDTTVDVLLEMIHKIWEEKYKLVKRRK